MATIVTLHATQLHIFTRSITTASVALLPTHLVSSHNHNTVTANCTQLKMSNRVASKKTYIMHPVCY
jgi:hypothetical protein